jgi:aminopeptidase N
MLRFFEDRAGVPYPEATYTQVLTVEGSYQEMSGFAVMPETYGRALLADDHANYLVAHELAHQWWGNQVTCRDFTHFWLNEGFATYMAAAYREHRFGRQGIWTTSTWRARSTTGPRGGKDRSLVFPNWDRPPRRPHARHQKGALVHELRETLGDRAFWDGIRRYTRANASPVTTGISGAMEQVGRGA